MSLETRVRSLQKVNKRVLTPAMPGIKFVKKIYTGHHQVVP